MKAKNSKNLPVFGVVATAGWTDRSIRLFELFEKSLTDGTVTTL